MIIMSEEIEKPEEKVSKIDSYYFLSTLTERILFLALITLISAAPLIFRDGLPAHADWHSHMANAFMFKRCFWQGELFPRWIEGNMFGYGLPKFNFYAPLLYYIFLVFEIKGQDCSMIEQHPDVHFQTIFF